MNIMAHLRATLCISENPYNSWLQWGNVVHA